jgi:hypothetical protein
VNTGFEIRKALVEACVVKDRLLARRYALTKQRFAELFS